ncbi:MAG: 2-succinyl-5-enolpyruvyl-6-hydroxy-3-cyclohexene-1-carboxylic-acid synthase [Verrucomicrobia bacterium]|nr:2-succinyl-5-enolpyruvyl-6-hydroxy-3-cyclohexene-1-carboxylic-acid synthase [Verrucomicrobiota bacterium]MCH8513271.1 2-succinyl-5-enolpyruvyl-6-hydroxy-3-cyclohexene-1-carboxylic-acid synthase [Kiritimatiellia bacterium]
MIQTENINLIWASLLVDECIRNGASTFFLAPGARCTPLTLAVARHPEARTVLHYDERGLGFAALGFARATGRPGVVVTSSGTAVSNLHPAVVEAGMDNQPLLLLTADRPPELRQTGANQAIDQVGHFAAATRWSFDMPCPDTAISPTMPLSTLDHALFRTRTGPVHLNCMFREPLAPLPDRTDAEAYLASLHAWYKTRDPYTVHDLSTRQVDEITLTAIEPLFTGEERVLLVAGGGLTEAEALAVTQLAEQRGWPVISDVTSGLHFGPKRSCVIRHVEALISGEGFPEALAPDLVVQFGPRFLSKTLLQALTHTPLQAWIQVTPRENRLDPHHQVTHRFCSEIDRFCFLLERVGSASNDPTWQGAWVEADRDIEACLGEQLDEATRISEPGVARAVARFLPNLHGLVLGASMPVRDMNTFAAENPNHIHVTANRGASGIDGTLATAAGFALGLQQCTTVLLGDLTFLHDLNSLALIRKGRFPVIVVVINNHGGGIFHFLPMANNTEDFEKFWGTPHSMNFEHAAAQFDLPYALPRDMAEFIDTYQDALENGESCIIEVQTDRQENKTLHMALAEKLSTALEDLKLA